MPAASFDAFYPESWIPRVPTARLAPSTAPVRSLVLSSRIVGARGTTSVLRGNDSFITLPCAISPVIRDYGDRVNNGLSWGPFFVIRCVCAVSGGASHVDRIPEMKLFRSGTMNRGIDSWKFIII